jgi:hypothetical protein
MARVAITNPPLPLHGTCKGHPCKRAGNCRAMKNKAGAANRERAGGVRMACWSRGEPFDLIAAVNIGSAAFAVVAHVQAERDQFSISHAVAPNCRGRSNPRTSRGPPGLDPNCRPKAAPIICTEPN